MRRVKLGVIGLGRAWEKLHAPALMQLKEQFEVTAVCDHHSDKAERAAGTMGVSPDGIFTDFKKMLKTGDFEAVATMVPISENYEAAKAVLESRRHLFAEKPFASSVTAAKELAALAQNQRVKVLVAENFRYAEENKIIKELLESKTLGNPVYFIDNNVCEFQAEMLRGGFESSEWRQHPDFRGGIFLDSAVHHIARHRFLFGEAQKICASGRPGGSDFCAYSSIQALLTFKDHIAGHYAYFNIGKETQAPLVGFRIFLTNGEIYLEEKDCGFVNVSFKKSGEHKAIPYRAEQGYYNELMNFYNALVNGGEIISTPEKEIGDIETVFKILEACDK